MLALLQETWVRIQADLKSRAGDAAYDSWLQALRPLALERGTVYLESENRMACDRVQRLYTPLLEDCLSIGIGTRLNVKVTPAPESLMSDGLEVSPMRPIIDECNKTAFLVLKSLIEKNRDLTARLFYFYGPPGVGKTFLLRWWRDADIERARIYAGESLRHAFQLKIRDSKLADLESELTTEKPLVIDGVHRFGRHRRVQRELLKILKRREERGLLTMLTSRWHPRDTWKLDAGITSFFLSGFVAEIQLPGHDARLRYLRALEGTASRNGRAAAVEKTAREVRGSFTDLSRAWTLDRHDLTHPRHSDYLQLIDPGREFRRLRDRVVERLDIPIDELLGKGQVRRVTLARQALAWLAVRNGLSQAEVGRYMNGRSRASISYSIKTIEKRMAESSEIRKLVEGLL